MQPASPIGTPRDLSLDTAVLEELDWTPDRGASRRVTDIDLHRDVERALRSSTTVPRSVTAEVRQRHVTLSGEVDWDFQRDAAARAVQDLRGVASLDNQVQLIPGSAVVNSERRLRSAMLRNPQIDPRNVTVTILESTAILTGHVSSLEEKKQAGLATGACPNVTRVENRLLVRPY